MPAYNARAEADAEKTYQAWLNEKVRVHLIDQRVLEGRLIEVSNDAITIMPAQAAAPTRIAKRDIDHITSRETGKSIFVASGIVVALILMNYCMQGFADAMSSLGH